MPLAMSHAEGWPCWGAPAPLAPSRRSSPYASAASHARSVPVHGTSSTASLVAQVSINPSTDRGPNTAETDRFPALWLRCVTKYL